MSEQQPPQGGPGEPNPWPRRFDPETGQPLLPSDQAPEAQLPLAAERTQFLGYQPSALPPGAEAPSEPLEHQSPWAGNAQQTAPSTPANGPTPYWQQPAGGSPYDSSTDALGRTMQPPPRRSAKTVVWLSVLSVLLCAGVATGTFLILNTDDENVVATNAAGSSSGTPSASASDSPSPSASSSTSPSTSPSATPSITAPATPEYSETPTPSAPTPNLKTFGAEVNIAEYAVDWNFRWEDIELSTKHVTAENYPSCAPVAKGDKLSKLGCKFAGQTIQENTEDGVRLVTFILQFDNAKQATAAAKQLNNESFNLSGRLPAKYADGMWKIDARKKFVVFTAATASKKIDERLLNRYAGYRNTDLSLALMWS